MMKRIEIGEGVMAVDYGDHLRLVQKPDAVIRAAAKVVLARNDGQGTGGMDRALEELTDALAAAGYDGRLPERVKETGR